VPAIKTYRTLDLPRRLRAFMRFEAGVGRGWPLDEANQIENLKRRLAQAEERLSRREAQLDALRQRPANRAQPHSVIDPADLIWIFGTARTGSTWLSAMIGTLDNNVEWREPYVGALFGSFYYEGPFTRLRVREQTILNDHHRDTWLTSIRTFVLDGAAARYPRFAERGYLVVKEPNGSVGAPLLMEALPESRMILLVRDPRDVVASVLDAATTPGSWGGGGRAYNGIPNDLVRQRSNLYLRAVGNSKQAYELHKGPKAFVKYENLRADTVSVLEQICSALEVQVSSKDIVRAVEKHSWENIPEEKKGQGKFYRKGIPGSWKEDLSLEQIDIVEEITAPLLEEFYPG
jgi:Sulfotransferase family